MSRVAGMSTPTVAPDNVTVPPPSVAGFGDAVPDRVHTRSLYVPVALLRQALFTPSVPGAACAPDVVNPIVTVPSARPTTAVMALRRRLRVLKVHSQFE